MDANRGLRVSKVRLLAICFLLTSPAFAHHSVPALYDFADVRTLHGTILNVRWINPHVTITLEIHTADGIAESWELEASGINMLQRAGITRDLLEVGDSIAASGPAARRGRKAMIAAIVELEGGTKATIFAPIAAAVGLIDSTGNPDTAAYIDDETDLDEAIRSGLFRVWTIQRKANVANLFDQLPLTDAARDAIGEYDPRTDDPALLCEPPGLPVMLDTPFPIAFVRRGNDIVMLFEEWDGVRTIHMGPMAPEFDNQPSLMGHSIGHFNDRTLTIQTRHIAYPFFDDVGTPQSTNSTVIERYTIGEDDLQLDWEASVTDPENFNAPVTFGGSLVWNPEEEIKPYNCTLL